MGQLNAGAPDIALMRPQTVTVGAAGVFPFALPIVGTYNVAIGGTFVATLQIERSFDGGVTYVPLSGATIGVTATFAAPTTFRGVEPERGVLYRVNCTAFTSGPATVRISG